MIIPTKFKVDMTRVAVGPERTGTLFGFFFWQLEPRSGSFLYKNSSQQCIRKCYLNSGVPRSWFKQQLNRDQYGLRQLQHTRFLDARKLAVGAGSQVSQWMIAT